MFWGAALTAGIAVAQFEAERQYEAHFMEVVKTLPANQQADAIRLHREAREKARIEALQERRHRELVHAIRDSRPIGFGCFW